jgi:hypothetical protein
MIVVGTVHFSWIELYEHGQPIWIGGNQECGISLIL